MAFGICSPNIQPLEGKMNSTNRRSFINVGKLVFSKITLMSVDRRVSAGNKKRAAQPFWERSNLFCSPPGEQQIAV